MTKHPIQNIIKTNDNITRFQSNTIVRFLLDTSKYDLNDLALMPFNNNSRN